MKNKSSIYSDLSNKQLLLLKELYIKKKVDSMSIKELRGFVLEIITHQIINTIGKDEEMEAWKEMSDFFGEEFEIIILDLQQKNKDHRNLTDDENDPQKQRIEFIERNNIEKEKKDMWDD